jgi:hypothetical protein
MLRGDNNAIGHFHKLGPIEAITPVTPEACFRRLHIGFADRHVRPALKEDRARGANA